MSGDKRPIPEDDGNRDEDLPELKKPRKSLLPRLFSPFLYTAQFNSNTITTFTNVHKSSQETKMRGLKNPWNAQSLVVATSQLVISWVPLQIYLDQESLFQKVFFLMQSGCNTLKWGCGDGSFLMEALKVEGFHKLWLMLEPLFRKVVSIPSFNIHTCILAVVVPNTTFRGW